jgi:polyisoprenyl-phosphate glycosyltransferase
MFLSIVSPVYKAEEIIAELVSSVKEHCRSLQGDVEIILVNDASPDGTWNVMEQIAAENTNITCINFSKNFGQHAAINAGLATATGQYIIVMDCDMQHHPKYIPELVAKIQQGFDIVFTTTPKRQHSLFKNFISAIYHSVYNYLTELGSDYNYTTYSIASKKVIDVYKTLQETNSHYLPKLRWLGFRQTSIKISHMPRPSGGSSYTFKTMFIEGIKGLTSNSVKLLRLNVLVGLILSAISFLAIITIILLYFIHGFMPGWPSIAVLIMFSLGIILTSVGITGLYIGQTFEQVQQRPHYIISEIKKSNSCNA